MILIGQVSLLVALIAAGYATSATVLVKHGDERRALRNTTLAALLSMAGLTLVMVILGWALAVKDFRFAYVAGYSSRLLPWHYSLSALWVGQEGSLLLWTWLLGAVALAFRFLPHHDNAVLRRRAMGILMAYQFFLIAVIVFAADPMKQSLTVSQEGVGLSPLLQHPAMLIHPPIVFLGYAAWAVPFALACAAVFDARIDTRWIRQARAWTLFAWMVLGAGIILGGNWAYEELGWGGYWAWDPVENGSLMPWLTGTALIHCFMAWQYRGMLKKTTVVLALVTFTLCNFATFLTRSGIFSSLHAFSQSPIGWTFLVMMVGLSIAGGIGIFLRRADLVPERTMSSLWSRESMILLANLGLALLTCATFVGTLMVPLSDFLWGKKIVVGIAFYNNAAIPIGLLLLCASAATPLLRWGAPPSSSQRRMLIVSAVIGCISCFVPLALGERSPLMITVFGCSGFALAALVTSLWLESYRAGGPSRLLAVVRTRRQQYAGYAMHLGFMCLAVGIAGSSLGSVRHEVVMGEGESITWCGYTIRLAQTREQTLPDKLIGEVELEVSRHGRVICTLCPAQHLHRHQNEWTTEVAIHSTWTRDFYTILHGAAGARRANLTLVINPLIRWIWLGGWIFTLGTLVRLWPARVRENTSPPIARPKFLGKVQKRSSLVNN